MVVGKVFKAASCFTVVFLVSESILETSLLPQRFHINTS